MIVGISRRARDRDGKITEPMTRANMRDNGVNSVVATCAKCLHEGVAQRWPADTPVPDVGLRLRCSACGGREIDTRPNWLEQGERRMW